MLKINRLNQRGNEMESVIELSNIVGIGEIEIPNEPLYDYEGNKVDERVNENIYEIYFNDGRTIRITKSTYTKLIEKLQVETL